MFLTLERLCERAGTLSNHIRRYIRAVEKHRERVVSRLEETGDLGRISFGDPAGDLPREMEIIGRVARNEDERRDFLAFYYALQYIIMEIHSLNLLRFHLTREPKLTAYGRCISYAKSQFRVLTSTYLDTLAGVLLPTEFGDRFALFGVGTMGDRDDIDVAVVDNLDADERPNLSHALGRLSQAMLRTSCTLHFHMAEAIGSPVLTESLERYVAFTQQSPYSPVVISQMICAQQLTGNERLGGRFLQHVTDRFYYHPGQPNHDHEGFLRAMLGELHELLQRPVSAAYINPKEDGLRLIKGYLALAKSVHHVPRSDWGAILDYLAYRHRHGQPELIALQQGLTYLEIVRYLYQLLVVEEEEIDTGDVGASSPSLEVLAGVMGYRRQGALNAHVPFLMEYYATVNKLRDALRVLLTPMEDHLRAVTSLSFFRSPAELKSLGGVQNLAVRHVSESRRYFGTRHWGDLLDEFCRDGSPAPQRYLMDLSRLSPKRRDVVLRGLTAWGVNDPASFLRFLVPIHRGARSLGLEPLWDEMVELFLRSCREEPLIAERLASIYNLWPERIHSFLRILDTSRLAEFEQLADRAIDKKELREAADTLIHLIAIHRHCSADHLRVFCAAVESHPEVLRQLTKPEELHATADAFYGQAERFSDLFGRREWMEAYHRLETTRLGLDFIEGKPYLDLLREYRIGMHILLRSLYFLCRKELYELYQMEWSKRHSIGVYLDAGCTGFHPLDDDLSCMVLLFRHDDDEIERFFGHVVTSFQKELAQLGITLLPYPDNGDAALVPRRLTAQRSMLEQLAERRADPLQVLYAFKFSRIVGTHGHLQRFASEVLGPVFEPIRDSASRLLMEDLNGQQERISGLQPDQPLDPLTMPGGIRDVERFYLYRCAMHGEQSVCDSSRACCIDAGDPRQMDTLRQNMILLQVLATARRLLRQGDSDSGIDAAFVRAQQSVLERRSEVPVELFADPVGHLMRIGGENVALMKSLVSRHVEASR